jgi:hypothetical protein
MLRATAVAIDGFEPVAFAAPAMQGGTVFQRLLRMGRTSCLLSNSGVLPIHWVVCTARKRCSSWRALRRRPSCRKASWGQGQEVEEIDPLQDGSVVGLHARVKRRWGWRILPSARRLSSVVRDLTVGK